MAAGSGESEEELARFIYSVVDRLPQKDAGAGADTAQVRWTAPTDACLICLPLRSAAPARAMGLVRVCCVSQAVCCVRLAG